MPNTDANRNRWYRCNLGDAMLAGDALDRIKVLFAQAHANAGQPADMAVFMRHESEGRLHCELKVYFSPAAAELAQALGASPCPAPSRSSLGLAAGLEESWEELFA